MRALTHAIALTTLVAVRATAAAQASAAPTVTAPSAHDTTTEVPAPGTYAMELTTDSGTLVGSLVVLRVSDALTARLAVAQHTPETKSFVREGPVYVLVVGTPDFTVTYRLRFTGAAVSGSFRMSSGATGTIAGTRAK
jgi:hypothetical protein